MTGFIPPYPERPAKALSMWRRLGLVRRNLIGVWEAPAFKWDFVRTRFLGRHIFICNSPGSVQFAFSTRNASFERKGPEMRRMLKPLIGDGLFISDGETLRRRRGLIAPIVHVSRLRQFAPVMVEAAVETRDRWEQVPAGQSIDVLADMGKLTAEIICRTLFGRDLGHHHASEIVEGFGRYQRAASAIDLPTLLALPDWFPRWPRPAVGRIVRRINTVLDEIIAGLGAQDREGAASSLMGQLIASRDEGGGVALTPIELRNEASVLFMAGYETTANTLAWVWYLISQSAQARDRLHAEIDTVLQGREPALGDVAGLPYVRAVVEETLRLYPPVPHLSREATETEEFQGQVIPKGSSILVIPWLLHRHRTLWPRPDEFDPSRFLDGGRGPVSKFAYVPFSVGPRVCPGLAFGMTEAILCIATLAQRFELRLQEGHVVTPVCLMTLRPGNTLPMTVRRRTAPAPAEAVPVEPASCPFSHG